MYRLLSIFLLLSLMSCDPTTVEPPTSAGNNCNIEVKIFLCETTVCAEKIPQQNLLVEIYTSNNEAINGINRIDVDSTNQNGWVKFYDLNCDANFFVRVDLGEHGVFIRETNFFNIARTDLMEIPLQKNLIYNNNSWAEGVQREISLEYPSTYQFSSYRYFEKPWDLTFDSQNNYKYNSGLNVSFNEQIGASSFVVGEYFNTQDGVNDTYFGDMTSYQESIWRFESDTLFVSDHDGVAPTSFLWNLTSEDGPLTQEFAIPLKTDSTYFLDMYEDFESPIPAWAGTGYCASYEINNVLFEDLLISKRNYNGTNEPLKYQVYNKKYGLVRSLHYLENGSVKSAGFDLWVQ